MTSVTLVQPNARGRGGLGRAPLLFDGVGGEPTLDELLAGVWEGLAAHRIVCCPVCGASMEPEYGAHAVPIAGRCRGCAGALT